MRFQRRGYGLVEVLIAMTLGALLLALLHRFLVPILLGSSKNSVQVHLSQQANILATRLERDLKATDGSGLSYVKNEQLTALGICRRNGLGPNGNRLYEQRLKVYFWKPALNQVRSFELDSTALPAAVVGDVTQAIHLDPDDLVALVNANQGSKLLAAPVLEFRPLSTWPPEPLNKIEVYMEQATGGTGQKAVYKLVKEVGFR